MGLILLCHDGITEVCGQGITLIGDGFGNLVSEMFGALDECHVVVAILVGVVAVILTLIIGLGAIIAVVVLALAKVLNSAYILPWIVLLIIFIRC